MKNLILISLIAFALIACKKDPVDKEETSAPSFYMPVPSKFSVSNLKSTTTMTIPELNLTPLPEKYWSDLILYLPLNGNANDSTGNFTPEVLDDAGNPASFNDLYDSTHIVISDQDLIFGKEFTICFWIYVDTVNFQGIQGVFEKQFGEEFKMQVNVRYNPVDEFDYPKLCVNIYKDHYIGSGGELKNGWNFFTIDLSQNYGDFNFQSFDFKDPLRIGDNKYQWSEGYPATHFTGGIDEFIIFNRYLSWEEISELESRRF